MTAKSQKKKKIKNQRTALVTMSADAAHNPTRNSPGVENLTGVNQTHVNVPESHRGRDGDEPVQDRHHETERGSDQSHSRTSQRGQDKDECQGSKQESASAHSRSARTASQRNQDDGTNRLLAESTPHEPSEPSEAVRSVKEPRKTARDEQSEHRNAAREQGTADRFPQGVFIREIR